MITTVTLNAALDKTYWLSSFQTGQVNRVRRQIIEPGGKGVNVAKVLASLGAAVNVTGFVGGSNGQELIRYLRPFHVNQNWVEVEGNTRVCLNIIDEEHRQETEILEKGPSISPDDWNRFVDKFRLLVTESDLVLLSGSLPAGVEDDRYAELIAICKAAGIKAGIDTGASALKKSLAAKPAIVKPNIHELQELCGKELAALDDIIAEAVAIYQSGIEYVIVSLGKDGAVCVSAEGIFKAELPRIQAVNSVGSGDAVFAGIGLALERAGGSREALINGMAAGMANALNEGAGRVKRQDYESFLQKVHIMDMGKVK